MKIRYQLFDVESGRFSGMTVNCGPDELTALTPPGTVALEAVDDPYSKLLVDGVLQPFERPAEETKFERTMNARRQIAELEARQARAIREQALNRGGTPAELRKRLEDIDDQIIALRQVINN